MYTTKYRQDANSERKYDAVMKKLDSGDLEGLKYGLEEMSYGGYLRASQKLVELMEEDRIPHDSYDLYKFRCFCCLQGDYGMCKRFLKEGIRINAGFEPVVVEDCAGPTEVHLPQYEPLEYLLEIDRDRTVRMLRGAAEGGNLYAMYRLGSFVGFEDYKDIAERQGEPHAVYDKYRSLGRDAEGDGYEAYNTDRAKSLLLRCADRDPQAALELAKRQYLGEGFDIDEGKALRYALFSADCGVEEAQGLLAFMTDRPDWSHSLRSQRYNTEYERGYGIPDRMGLQLSTEWSLLLRIARCDSYGWCYSDRTNEEGGFHCDDFDIRPFDYNIEDGSDPPNFEFRPGGLRMWWYKYPWRAGEMNMPLTLKQVLDVFALCIDSLRFGFGIEGTSVEDVLEMYPRTKVDVPEYLEERFQRAMVGMKSGADDTGYTYCSAQYRWGHQYADDGSDDASWWISSGIDGYECSRNHSRRQQLGGRSA